MFKRVLVIGSLASILFLSACFPHKPFVASGYEPVMLKQKGDFEVAASCRPLKFYKVNTTYAVNNFLGIRVGYSGISGLDNFDASLILYKLSGHQRFFMAPTFNYQRNLLKKDYYYARPNAGRQIDYDCEYSSPGLVLGYGYEGSRNLTHQLILKLSYNITWRYSAYYYSDNGKGRETNLLISDEEFIRADLGNFYSGEISYSLIRNIFKKRLPVRFQLAAHFAQRLLSHQYIRRTEWSVPPVMVNDRKYHPAISFVNFSVGFIIKSSRKPAGPADNLPGTKK